MFQYVNGDAKNVKHFSHLHFCVIVNYVYEYMTMNMDLTYTKASIYAIFLVLGIALNAIKKEVDLNQKVLLNEIRELEEKMTKD